MSLHGSLLTAHVPSVPGGRLHYPDFASCRCSDSEDIGRMPLGVKALATSPLKSSKRDAGLRDVAVMFAGLVIQPGDWLYADKDGILVSRTQLLL